MPSQYPSEFRRSVCDRLLSGEPVRALQRDAGVTGATLYRWKKQALIDAGRARGEHGRVGAAVRGSPRIAELGSELQLVKDASELFEATAGVPPTGVKGFAEGLLARGQSQRLACRVAGVPRPSFQRRTRPGPPADRAIRRLLTTDAVGALHSWSRGTYGARRITAALRIERGLIVNHKVVASILSERQLQGLPRKRKDGAASSTPPSPSTPPARASCTAPSSSTILLTDHGPQFTSRAFTENVPRQGLRISMGTVGGCYDNAMIEAFWGRRQTEL